MKHLILALGLGLLFTACADPEKKPDPKPDAKPAVECKLKGAWAMDADEKDAPEKQRSLTLKFEGETDITGTGAFKIGTRSEPNSVLTLSGPIVRAIEDKQTGKGSFKFGDSSEECDVKFVEDCANLSLTCNSAPMILHRTK